MVWQWPTTVELHNQRFRGKSLFRVMQTRALYAYQTQQQKRMLTLFAPKFQHPEPMQTRSEMDVRLQSNAVFFRLSFHSFFAVFKVRLLQAIELLTQYQTMQLFHTHTRTTKRYRVGCITIDNDNNNNNNKDRSIERGGRKFVFVICLHVIQCCLEIGLLYFRSKLSSKKFRRKEFDYRPNGLI